ncbi:RNA 2',3'-cyclic phosphodiesterase [Massilia eurypsychrophila]|jgi:2'-5' RNA ligase|uniref:RNA 2',3'-cyclic phosphodiesterase n=1 Tax=Massilia eurypsychrophila TaxID=1485217 RepID=A0A2G8TJY5_9BURK|nr:RNA 2',3'-cyclic phosphodiesterase [Massilia eurypsychrophila]PIL46353.1 RNA 2',3'-cyclic phosphodiesterase [Massilia eurypsychrophila]
MSDDAARMFIALWPDDAVRAALSQWRDGVAWRAAAAPVRSEQLHVTLHFLGSVARARMAELAHGIDVPFEPFELEFGHRELWHGSVAVLAPELVPAPLLALHASLAEALERLGMTPEARPYRPHVTLARRASPLTETTQGPPIRWRVEGYALMQSKAGAGSGYSIVQAYGS